MSLQNVPRVGYARAMRLVRASIAAQVPVLLVAPPGTGKTAGVARVCRDLRRKLWVILASTHTEITLAGVPAVVDGIIRRLPLECMAALRDGSGVLFLDELTCTSPSTLAALLRVLLERIAGDVALHPRVAVVAAANEPEHAPNAADLPSSVVARCCIVRLAPTVEEVLHYLANEVGTARTAIYDASTPDAPEIDEVDVTHLRDGGPLRDAALDYAATAATEARLVQIEPPRECSMEMRPWASPRQIEAGLWISVVAREIAKVSGLDAMEQEEDGRAALAGCVGVEAGDAYLAVRKLREFLPTLNEIATNPKTAKVPDVKAHQFAALGLLSQVAASPRSAAYSAWIYAARLCPEVGTAAARMLMGYPMRGAAALKDDGERAKLALQRTANRAVGV